MGKEKGILEATFLTSDELEILIVQKEELNFSKERLVEMLKKINIQHPEIILAQAKQESSYGTSPLFKSNNNLFGMKEAKSRIKTAKGTKRKHACYNNWQESVYDIAFWQSSYANKLTEIEYYNLLGRIYAEDTNYVSRLKSIIKRDNLKQLFK
jgi:flagellum-specific peptidoglycan hydrolase FlgJ